ncbi:M3 family metallopeptidase [Nocardia cyriacigeorgica]|uniref:M3 family metallopeptidase n=1 Tax=Nocardia cyriacigeorgica TaxID=135487 RepID=UPI0024586318|nr:M3 family metallopeptidase [Nocardia cyriacigeorgica]
MSGDLLMGEDLTPADIRRGIAAAEQRIADTDDPQIAELWTEELHTLETELEWRTTETTTNPPAATPQSPAEPTPPDRGADDPAIAAMRAGYVSSTAGTYRGPGAGSVTWDSGAPPEPNPLLTADENLDAYGMVRWDLLESKHLIPAMEAAVEEFRRDILAITDDPAEATIANTLDRFAAAGKGINRVDRVVAVIADNHKDPERFPGIDEIIPKIRAMKSDIVREVFTNEAFFDRVRALYQQRENLALDAATAEHLQRLYQDFRRTGIDLPDKELLKEIDNTTAARISAYNNNMLEAYRDSAIHVTDVERLSGMSPAQVEAARFAAESRGIPGYLIELTPTSSGNNQPLLEVLDDRELRRELYIASTEIGSREEHNNTAPGMEVVKERARKAQALGNSDYAEFVAEEEPVRPEQWLAVLDKLIPPTVAASHDELRQGAELLGLEKLEAWDVPYAKRKAQTASALTDDATTPPGDEPQNYLELDRVIDSGFRFVAEKVFGLTYTERFDIPTLHPDIRTFEVTDADGKKRGLVLFDPFARPTKRGGAWTHVLVDKFNPTGQLPVSIVSLNVPKPPPGEPVLLSWDWVGTLFHEFGHSVNVALGSGVLEQLGMRMPRNWAEFPAQVMEMFRSHPAVFQRYAKHHSISDKKMPRQMAEALLASRQSHMGIGTARNLAYTILDLMWYQSRPDELPTVPDLQRKIRELEVAVLAEHGLDLPYVTDSHTLQHYGHIIGSSYGGVMFAYLVADILAQMTIQHAEQLIEQHGLTSVVGDWLRDNAFGHNETGLREIVDRLLGDDPDVSRFLETRGIPMDRTPTPDVSASPSRATVDQQGSERRRVLLPTLGDLKPPKGADPGPIPGPGLGFQPFTDPDPLDLPSRRGRRRPRGGLGPDGLDPFTFFYNTPDVEPPGDSDPAANNDRAPDQPLSEFAGQNLPAQPAATEDPTVTGQPIGSAMVRILEIGPDADAERIGEVITELVTDLVDISDGNTAWSFRRGETVELLIDELASNILNHPEAEGVVVVTWLWTAAEVEAISVESRVRGVGRSPQLNIAPMYADDYGIEYGADGYTAWVVMGDEADGSVDLVAALSDREAHASDRSAELTVEPIPEWADTDYADSAQNSVDRLIAVLGTPPDGLTLTVLDRQPDRIFYQAFSSDESAAPVARNLDDPVTDASEMPAAAQANGARVRFMSDDPQVAPILRGAIDDASPGWGESTRAAIARTVGDVVGAAEPGATVTVRAEPREALGLRVTITHADRRDIPPQLIRILDLTTTAWSTDVTPEFRRVVLDFRRLDDEVIVAPRDAAGSNDDPIVDTRTMEFVPQGRPPIEARNLVSSLLSERVRHVDVGEAMTLAQQTVQDAMDRWREDISFIARVTQSGLLTMEIVRDRVGMEPRKYQQVVFRPSGAAEPQLSISDHAVSATMMAAILEKARTQMARHRWTDPDHLAAAETVLYRRITDFASSAGDSGPWRVDVHVSGEPDSKVLALTVTGPQDREAIPLVELFQRTVNSAPNSPAALAFYRNSWLVDLHWWIGSDPIANVSDMFDGVDAFARGEHLFPAGADPVQVLARPAALVDRLFDSVPAELIRADARQAATSLTIGLVDDLVAGPRGEALLTGMVTMGRDGLEFRVAVADRTPGDDSIGQAYQPPTAHLTTRSGREQWGGGSVTWAAVDLRPGAEETGTVGIDPAGGEHSPTGPGTGRPGASNVLDTIADALGESRPVAMPRNEATDAPVRRDIDDILADIDEVAPRQEPRPTVKSPEPSAPSSSTSPWARRSASSAPASDQPNRAGSRPTPWTPGTPTGSGNPDPDFNPLAPERRRLVDTVTRSSLGQEADDPSVFNRFDPAPDPGAGSTPEQPRGTDSTSEVEQPDARTSPGQVPARSELARLLGGEPEWLDQQELIWHAVELVQSEWREMSPQARTLAIEHGRLAKIGDWIAQRIGYHRDVWAAMSRGVTPKERERLTIRLGHLDDWLQNMLRLDTSSTQWREPSSENPFAELRDIAARLRAAGSPSDDLTRFVDLAERALEADSGRHLGADPLLDLVRAVNPLAPRATDTGDDSAYVNCADCAVVIDRNIDGKNYVASPRKTWAALQFEDGHPRSPFIDAHYATQFRPVTSLVDLETELSDGGHLARGMLAYRKSGSEEGHILNVVNDHGIIRYLDGQIGRDVTTDTRWMVEQLADGGPSAYSIESYEFYFLRTDKQFTGLAAGTLGMVKELGADAARNEPGAPPGFIQLTGPVTGVADSSNPLITADDNVDTYGMVQWDLLHSEHLIPAMHSAIAELRAEVAAIADDPAPATIANTLDRFAAAGNLFNRVVLTSNVISGNLKDEERFPGIKMIIPELTAMASAIRNEIFTNKAFFERVRKLYEQRDELGLDPATGEHLERLYRDFHRTGIDLPADDQAALEEIDDKIASLISTYESNITAATRDAAIHVTDVGRLSGLSTAQIETAKFAAQSRGFADGYLIELAPAASGNYQPLLEMLDDRELRELLYHAATEIGRGVVHNNTDIAVEVMRLRADRAALLGYPDHTAFVAEGEPVSPQQWSSLLERLIPPTVAAARDDLAKGAEALGLPELSPWDVPHARRRTLTAQEDSSGGATTRLSDDAPNYFELDQVFEEGFGFVAKELFGLTFTERPDIRGFHPDVRTFEVTDDDGTKLGLVLWDPFARPGKNGGAWTQGIVSKFAPTEQLPVCVVVTNFAEPPPDQPTLLSWVNVRTVFHEFGHAVNILVGDGMRELLGSRKPRTWAEFPAQVLELFRSHPQMIRRYARHHDTGEPMPESMIDELLTSSQVQMGMGTARIFAYTVVDRLWHSERTPLAMLSTTDAADRQAAIRALEDAELARHGLDLTYVLDSHPLQHFGHIIGFSYGGVMYAYPVTELLAKMVTSTVEQLIEQHGLTREVGDWMRENIFRHEEVGLREIVEGYLGDDPDVAPFLEPRGISVDRIPAGVETSGEQAEAESDEAGHRGPGADAGPSRPPDEPVQIPPAALRSLARAQAEADEVVREALRPAARLGIDVTHVIGKSTQEIGDALLGIMSDTRRARMDGALRRLVIDGVIARVLAEDGEFSKINHMFVALRRHIDEWHRYVNEIRSVLPILAAREVLAAKGAQFLYEGVGRVRDAQSDSGWRVVVVSPMLGQMRLLDMFSAGFRQRMADEGTPIEYWHIRVDDDGHVGVEQISGGDPEPLWGFRYYINDSKLWLNDLADDRSFAEKLTEAEARGVASRLVIKEPNTDSTMSEQVTLVIYANGFCAVEKTVRSAHQADAEELATLVLRAIGVHTPDVVRRDHVFYTPYIPDVLDITIGESNWSTHRHTPDARRNGLGEVLTRPWDRYEGQNFGFVHGVRLVPIDHSNSFDRDLPTGGFSSMFVQSGGGPPKYLQHNLPRAELDGIRSRVAALREDFARLNRISWFEGVMNRLEAVGAKAEDDTAPPALTLPEVIQELERLRDELATQFGVPLAYDNNVTPRQWSAASDQLRREFAGRDDQQALVDIDRFDYLNKLLRAAYLLDTRAVELLETDEAWPGLMDAYLDVLTLRLADLAEGGRYPAPNNESDAEWQARFDREIRAAEAELIGTSHTAGDSPAILVDHDTPAPRIVHRGRWTAHLDKMVADYMNLYGTRYFGATAEIKTGGVLHVTIRTSAETPTDRQMFDDLMAEAPLPIREIDGRWELLETAPGIPLENDLTRFNNSLASDPTLTMEDAALEHTFIGEMAKNHGYTRVRFLSLQGDDTGQSVQELRARGEFTLVHARFSRDAYPVAESNTMTGGPTSPDPGAATDPSRRSAGETPEAGEPRPSDIAPASGQEGDLGLVDGGPNGGPEREAAPASRIITPDTTTPAQANPVPAGQPPKPWHPGRPTRTQTPAPGTIRSDSGNSYNDTEQIRSYVPWSKPGLERLITFHSPPDGVPGFGKGRSASSDASSTQTSQAGRTAASSVADRTDAPTDIDLAYAEDALRDLGPGARATDLLLDRKPDGDVVAAARDRAAQNAAWWHELGTPQKEAVVLVHPAEVGNAYGLPGAVKDAANRLALERDLGAFVARRPERLGSGQLVNPEFGPDEPQRLRNILDARKALARAEQLAAAVHPEVAPPLVQLLAYSDGEVEIGFGDSDDAKSISRHVLSRGASLSSLIDDVVYARNHYEATARLASGTPVAVVLSHRHDAPGAAKAVVVQDARLVSGNIAGFNGSRMFAAQLPDGAPMPVHHIFGYGPSAAAIDAAAAQGALSGEVQTVTLADPRGAGRSIDSTEYRVEQVNIVETQSKRFTVLGTDLGRFFGRSAHTDPFARRLVVEPAPVAGRSTLERYLSAEPDTRVATPSLTMLAGIAASAPTAPTGGPPHTPVQDGHQDLSDTLPADPPLTRAERELAHQARNTLKDHLGPNADLSSLMRRIDRHDVVGSTRRRTNDNARWWQALSSEQQSAMVRLHPHMIGNTDGVPFAVRDAANRLSMTRDLDTLLERRSARGDLSRADHRKLENLETARDHLAAIERGANETIGSPAVQLLSFSAVRFGGNGAASVSIGDADRAATVTRHVGGFGTTLQSLLYRSGFARNQYEVSRQLSPDEETVSIIDIGYHHPTGYADAAKTIYADVGGFLVAQSVVAYNATREFQATLPEGSAKPRLVTLAGHNYGSATVTQAGMDGLLDGEIDHAILAGTPGTRMRHAREFGPNVEVYVTTSSRDVIGWFGADTPGRMGRVFGKGLGVDPANATWGAVRIQADFAPDFGNWMAVHQGYFSFADPETREPTTSLLGIGLVTVGRGDEAPRTEHRPAVDEPNVRQRIMSIPADFERRRARPDRPSFWVPQVVSPRGVAASFSRVDDGSGTRPDLGEGIPGPGSFRAPHPDTLPTAAPPSPAEEMLTRSAFEASRLVRNATDLLHGDYSDEEVVALTEQRTELNFRWWHALSEDQQKAVLRAHPAELGNADGIPFAVRDEANRLAIARDLIVYRNRLPVGADIEQWMSTELSDAERLHLRNLVYTHDALSMAELKARSMEPTVPAPRIQVMAYDAREFGGSGRAAVGFGDGDRAGVTLWQIPGITTTLQRLNSRLTNSSNLYAVSAKLDPSLDILSIAWLGYDAPSGGKMMTETISPQPAIEGGRLLVRDLVGFDTTRTLQADLPDGSPPPLNRLYAHSYGSTTMAYAAAGGRLRGRVKSVLPLGSPGMGPLEHADQFEVDEVYVAAGSRDPVTWLGSSTLGQPGRFAGRGQGMDPATEQFGAHHRIPSEFPDVPRFSDALRTHRQYWQYIDAVFWNPTEPLGYFGLIAVGRGNEVPHAPLRPSVENPTWLQRQVGSRLNDPEAERTASVGDWFSYRPRSSPQPVHEPATESTPAQSRSADASGTAPAATSGTAHARPAGRPPAMIGTMGVPDPDAPLDGGGKTPWDRGPKPGRGQSSVERLAQLNVDGGGAERGGGKGETPPSQAQFHRANSTPAAVPTERVEPSKEPPVDFAAGLEAALLRASGFDYIRERPANQPGEPTGAAFFDTDLQLAWERDWLAANGPMLSALGAFTLAATEAEKLLGMPNTTSGPVLLVQERPRLPGETLYVWKAVSLGSEDPADASIIGDLGRQLSLDEIPQYAYIAIVAARPLNKVDIERTREILTPAEDERFMRIPRDGVFTSQYPGCRNHVNGSLTYLQTRYYADVLLPEIASPTFYGYLMDDVVIPYQRRHASKLVNSYRGRVLSANDRIGQWFATTVATILHAPPHAAARILSRSLRTQTRRRTSGMSPADHALREFAVTVDQLLDGHTDFGKYLHHRARPEYLAYIDHVRQTVSHRHPPGSTAHIPFIHNITGPLPEPPVTPQHAGASIEPTTRASEHSQPSSDSLRPAEVTEPRQLFKPHLLVPRSKNETGHGRLSTVEEVCELIADKNNLLLDVDGPVCSVFGMLRDHMVAEEIRRAGRLWQPNKTLPESIQNATDPFAVVRFIASSGEEYAVSAEQMLTELEIRAMDSAVPTNHAHDMIRTAAQHGRQVFLGSNNATSALHHYAAKHGLENYLKGIYGRSSHYLSRLKPDRFVLDRILADHNILPMHCVYVGDSTTDIIAAHAIGMPAIALADKPGKVDAFEPYEPDAVIGDMGVLLRALLLLHGDTAPPNRSEEKPHERSASIPPPAPSPIPSGIVVPRVELTAAPGRFDDGATGGPAAPGQHGSTIPIIGTDPSTGLDIEIDPNDVIAVTLPNSDGHGDVVVLPSTDDPDGRLAFWASRPNRTHELCVYTAYRLPDDRVDYGPPEDAAWQREVLATGKSPFIVFAHASANFYVVQVRSGETTKEVFLDGIAYGRLLANTERVMEMLSTDEYRALIIGSCSPAQLGSATAQYTADYLINDAEMYRNIHFCTSNLLCPSWGDNSFLAAEAVITPNGLHQPTFESYWGSPWADEFRPR